MTATAERTKNGQALKDACLDAIDRYERAINAVRSLAFNVAGVEQAIVYAQALATEGSAELAKAATLLPLVYPDLRAAS